MSTSTVTFTNFSKLIKFTCFEVYNKSSFNNFSRGGILYIKEKALAVSNRLTVTTPKSATIYFISLSQPCKIFVIVLSKNNALRLLGDSSSLISSRR